MSEPIHCPSHQRFFLVACIVFGLSVGACGTSGSGNEGGASGHGSGGAIGGAGAGGTGSGGVTGGAGAGGKGGGGAAGSGGAAGTGGASSRGGAGGQTPVPGHAVLDESGLRPRIRPHVSGSRRVPRLRNVQAGDEQLRE